MDETRIKVLKEKGGGEGKNKWMWVSKGGPPEQSAIMYDYDPTRSKAVPERLLAGFSGALQCDGLASYDEACTKYKLKQLGCMDHARRKFSDAIKAQPAKKPKKNKGGKVSKAEVALGKINQLYRIEREIKDESPEEKYRVRQTKSIGKLNELKSWLEKNKGKVVKDGLTYKAIHYMLNQWQKLIRYCDDGRYNISNAGAENVIRPFVVGRKRWLFSDTPKGANASAIHYSLIETAKANGLEPQDYYNYILPKIAYAETPEALEELLPWNVKRALQKNSDKA